MTNKSKLEKRKENIMYSNEDFLKLTKKFDIYNSHENRNFHIKSKTSNKYKINFRKVLILYFIFSSLFIECNQRKLEAKYSYITYKIKAKSYLTLYSHNYLCR